MGSGAAAAAAALPPPPPPPAAAAWRHLRAQPTWLRELVAGGAAGALAKTAVAPLERAKILFQTGRLARGGVAATLRAVVRAEGPRGLFVGNGAAVLRIVPYAAVHFGVYEEYRRALVARAYGGPRPPGGVSPLLDLAAGAAAGATAVVLTYPLDLVRTRLAFATEARGAGASAPAAAAAAEAAGAGAAGAGGAAARPLPPPRPSTPPPFRFLPHADPAHSIRGVLSTTLAAEGAAGLYKGLGPSMWGILPYAGLKFFVYQSLKRAHLARAGGGGARPAGGGGAAGGGPRLPVAAMLSYGAAAGVAAQTVTYPLDVVRRRMQVEGLLVGKGGAAAGGGGAAGASGPGGAGGSSTDARLPRSTPAALRAIAARHGWRALYSGLAINYMKVVPSTAIGFAAYDYLKAALDLPSNL